MTRNGLNEENQATMLWAVWNECPSGAQFIFNCYLHWYTLVIRDGGGFLYINKVVTQGYPPTMIVYGLGFLPLIRELQAAHPKLHNLGTLMK